MCESRQPFFVAARQGLKLVRPAQPGILPRRREVLVVAAIPDVDALAVAEFQGLVLGYWDRACASDARTDLAAGRVLYTVETCRPAEPEIAVERKPEPLLYIVAEVPFEGPDGFLRLGIGARKRSVVREELWIRGEKRDRQVPVEHPVAPAFGVAKFWFEAPAVGAPID